MTVANAVALRIEKLSRQKNMTQYRLEKKFGHTARQLAMYNERSYQDRNAEHCNNDCSRI